MFNSRNSSNSQETVQIHRKQFAYRDPSHRKNGTDMWDPRPFYPRPHLPLQRGCLLFFSCLPQRRAAWNACVFLLFFLLAAAQSCLECLWFPLFLRSRWNACVFFFFSCLAQLHSAGIGGKHKRKTSHAYAGVVWSFHMALK